MTEEEFYEGFEEHLRKLYAGGWAPESIPGRNAQEEFTKWLTYLKARAWDEGYLKGVEEANDLTYYQENPYREPHTPA